MAWGRNDLPERVRIEAELRVRRCRNGVGDVTDSILVVDDDADVRHSVRALLESAGFQAHDFDALDAARTVPERSEMGTEATRDAGRR